MKTPADRDPRSTDQIEDDAERAGAAVSARARELWLRCSAENYECGTVEKRSRKRWDGAYRAACLADEQLLAYIADLEERAGIAPVVPGARDQILRAAGATQVLLVAGATC